MARQLLLTFEFFVRPQKKSREESQGAESGVEILVNEPYEEGPGGSGQYTHKIYHVGKHLPGRLSLSSCRMSLLS